MTKIAALLQHQEEELKNVKPQNVYIQVDGQHSGQPPLLPMLDSKEIT